MILRLLLVIVVLLGLYAAWALYPDRRVDAARRALPHIAWAALLVLLALAVAALAYYAPPMSILH